MAVAGLTGLAGATERAAAGLGLFAGGGAAATAGWIFGTVGPVAGAAGLTSVLVALMLVALAGWQKVQGRYRTARALDLVAHDTAAWFATNEKGQVLWANAAARKRFGTDSSEMLEGLRRSMTNPAAVLLRLQNQAELHGSAQQDIRTWQGSLRISVQRSGAARFLWRIEDFATESVPSAPLPDRSAVEAGGADLEEVPVALMTFGPDGLLRTANRMARDLMLQGELRSMMFHDLFEGLGRPVSDWLSDVVSGRIPGGTEVLRARKMPQETFLQVTLHRFVDGGRSTALAVLNDATRLKTLEAQFVQSQKMQAIGQLAGGIAHDFNNLLTAISGHCDLLLLRHGRDDPDFGDLQQIGQNANRAASLVGQLLGFSRKQTLKPERLDLEDVLGDLTHLLTRLLVERVELNLLHLRHGEKDLQPVRADRRQLEQVLINLVVNARDAMPQGGKITIETESLTLIDVLKRDRASVPPGDYTVIRVGDNGIGIPPENLQKIFEPFFTTKRVGEGTGLGLSMAYGIVKQSGGFIFVDSAPGEGTVFSIYLPVAGPEDPPQMSEPEPLRVLLKQGEGVILLVEDEAPVRAFASRALRLRGYTVLEATSAEEALKLLEDDSLEVDVFVTDVVMPGLDGPSWVKLALQARPHVRVIFVSGYAEDSLSEDQARVPNSVFLPKPFSLNDLTATVQDQLDHGPDRRAGQRVPVEA